MTVLYVNMCAKSLFVSRFVPGLMWHSLAFLFPTIFKHCQPGSEHFYFILIPQTTCVFSIPLKHTSLNILPKQGRVLAHVSPEQLYITVIIMYSGNVQRQDRNFKKAEDISTFPLKPNDLIYLWSCCDVSGSLQLQI